MRGKKIQAVNKFPMPLSPKFICIFGTDEKKRKKKICDTQRGLMYYQGFKFPLAFLCHGKKLATIMPYFLLECMHFTKYIQLQLRVKMLRLTKERMTGLLLSLV